MTLRKQLSNKVSTLMPGCEIYFRCNECENEHPLHLRIHPHEGPDHKDTC